MDGQFRVGIAGDGEEAELYAAALRRLAPEVTAVAVAADDDDRRVRAFAARLGIPQVFDSAAEMIGSGIDGLVVATAAARQAELVTAGLGADLQVLCAPPMGRNAREADAMMRAAEGSGGGLTICYPYGTEAGETIRRVRFEALLGPEILHVEGRWFYGDPHDATEQEPGDTYGGAAAERCAHLLSIVTRLFGDELGEVSEVSAAGSHGSTPDGYVELALHIGLRCGTVPAHAQSLWEPGRERDHAELLVFGSERTLILPLLAGMDARPRLMQPDGTEVAGFVAPTPALLEEGIAVVAAEWVRRAPRPEAPLTSLTAARTVRWILDRAMQQSHF